jgi:hypothetical protein
MTKRLVWSWRSVTGPRRPLPEPANAVGSEATIAVDNLNKVMSRSKTAAEPAHTYDAWHVHNDEARAAALARDCSSAAATRGLLGCGLGGGLAPGPPGSEGGSGAGGGGLGSGLGGCGDGGLGGSGGSCGGGGLLAARDSSGVLAGGCTQRAARAARTSATAAAGLAARSSRCPRCSGMSTRCPR